MSTNRAIDLLEQLLEIAKHPELPDSSFDAFIRTTNKYTRDDLEELSQLLKTLQSVVGLLVVANVLGGLE